METLKKTESDWSAKLHGLSHSKRTLLACILEEFDWDVGRLHAALVRADNLISSEKVFSELLAEFVEARMKSGVSDAYLRIIRSYVGDFERYLKPGTSLGEITPEGINVWIGDEALSEADKRRRLKALCTIFNFAIERGYGQLNPAMELLRRKRTESHGWVYIIEANGRFKIGMTSDPNLVGRTKYYGTAHPGPVLIKALIKTESPRRTERHLHKLFKSRGRHIKNEWFNLTGEDFEMLARDFGEAYVVGDRAKVNQAPQDEAHAVRAAKGGSPNV
jgi:hypothetical protein